MHIYSQFIRAMLRAHYCQCDIARGDRRHRSYRRCTQCNDGTRAVIIFNKRGTSFLVPRFFKVGCSRLMADKEVKTDEE